MLCSSCGKDVGNQIRLCDTCEEAEAQKRAALADSERPTSRFRKKVQRTSTEEFDNSSGVEQSPDYPQELEEEVEPSLGQLFRQPLIATLFVFSLLAVFSLVAVILTPKGIGIFLIGAALVLIGSLIGLIAWILLLIYAFEENAAWGFAYIFLYPIVLPIFSILHWERSKKAVLATVLSIILNISGVGLMIAGAYQQGKSNGVLNQSPASFFSNLTVNSSSYSSPY